MGENALTAIRVLRPLNHLPLDEVDFAAEEILKVFEQFEVHVVEPHAARGGVELDEEIKIAALWVEVGSRRGVEEVQRANVVLAAEVAKGVEVVVDELHVVVAKSPPQGRGYLCITTPARRYSGRTRRPWPAPFRRVCTWRALRR